MIARVEANGVRVAVDGLLGAAATERCVAFGLPVGSSGLEREALHTEREREREREREGLVSGGNK